ncbi:uncharacterized protein C8A04DRAFT_37458 [Dichotomopilus funicola]|uniref:N-acetyltransferase domain-containing protein n=1 Tax=Dichotomopilus funicola TaxID=1934379 RepID=A0AAN6V2W6_9PEZI|nr:hypothetical protein C8A04DRAFT_37458 [Dichotomopilus funicola]
MPAIINDPDTPTIYRVSGDAPFPDPANPAVPPAIQPRQVTLRDRLTVATIVPVASRDDVPESLLRYLSDQFNKEIEGGDTYPILEPMTPAKFAAYWFQNFGGIMLLGHLESAAEVVEGMDWSKECLGTFYIRPNYPGRSSHISNAGFIVTDASRNRGVGRLLGESYLDWAPKLGYKYAIFNLVYETNVASCKLWDGLGFKRIGRVKGAGNLKSHPDRLVDAIIYGRDLGDAAGGVGGEELVSEERFDKIKFYLKYGRYPTGADRAEKSRLRSAATHYKLLDGDVLMLKDKEVISDPQRQYEIARMVHNQAHGGINKTTATIAERYHWSRIKETVSDVIRNCPECKDANKTSAPGMQPSLGSGVMNGLKRANPSPASGSASKRASPSPSAPGPALEFTTGGERPSISDPSPLSAFSVSSHHHFADPSAISILSDPQHHHSLTSPTRAPLAGHDAMTRDAHNPMLQSLHPHHHPPPSGHPVTISGLDAGPHPIPVPDFQPIDPQIIAQSTATAGLHHHQTHHHHHHHHPHAHDPYPFSHPSPPSHHNHDHHHHDPDPDADVETFQALLNAAVTDDEDDDPAAVDHALSVGARTGSDLIGPVGTDTLQHQGQQEQHHGNQLREDHQHTHDHNQHPHHPDIHMPATPHQIDNVHPTGQRSTQDGNPHDHHQIHHTQTEAIAQEDLDLEMLIGSHGADDADMDSSLDNHHQPTSSSPSPPSGSDPDSLHVGESDDRSGTGGVDGRRPGRV